MGDDKIMSNILEIENLVKRYEDDVEGRAVIDGMSLSVEEREFLCILGPSGCGKSTLLRCIAGFEKYEGQIKVDGKIESNPGTDRIMVFQDFNQLFPWLTVEKNIILPLKKQGIKDKQEQKKIVDSVLEKVHLSGYGSYYPHQLSGGMKQRVAIAKALALKSRIILMDEPFAALDAMTRTNLQKEMQRISDSEECTIIFITHNIQEAIVLGTRIMVLSSGGVIEVDKKNPLEKPVTPASKQYGELWDELRTALYQEEK